MNNSLTRLYQSHGHSSVMATVTPVQRSNDAATVTTSPISTTDDNCEKIALAQNLELKESHVDSSQSIKEPTQPMVCY